MPDSMSTWQAAFLDQHRLQEEYLHYAQRWFIPLADRLAAHHDGAVARGSGSPLVIGVNGSQGSGKTTLCAYIGSYLQARYGLRSVALSLDDFYLTLAERRELAAVVHPLLATRGVPGTHDMALLKRTLDALSDPAPSAAVAIPRFDKATDDRHRQERWDKVEGRLDLILLEGWCMGAQPQSDARLLLPVNSLEREEDAGAYWRRHVNNALQRDFLPLYGRIDQWVMLQAPSFDCIYRWRLEQEHKLAAAASGDRSGVMSDEQVAHFIQHYQRLTEHCLERLPPRVDYLYSLDEQRRIVASRPCFEGAA